jgi:hypothetical protein
MVVFSANERVELFHVTAGTGAAVSGTVLGGVSVEIFCAVWDGAAPARRIEKAMQTLNENGIFMGMSGDEVTRQSRRSFQIIAKELLARVEREM